MLKNINPQPSVGQRWRLNQHEGVILRIHPGGAGEAGIAEFDTLPPAHVSTMMRFGAWSFVPMKALPPPCTCITTESGAILSDGCPAHDAMASHAKNVAAQEPAELSR